MPKSAKNVSELKKVTEAAIFLLIFVFLIFL